MLEDKHKSFDTEVKVANVTMIAVIIVLLMMICFVAIGAALVI